MSQLLGLRVQVWLTWVSLAQAFSCYQAELPLIQSFTGEGPTFRSSRWSGRVQILTSSKIQFLTGCGPEAPQISATGVSPQSSSQHGSCFPQSEGVRGGTQLIFYSLEASHLSQPHQWEGVKWGISASRQSIGGQLRGCHRRGEAKILSCHIKSIQPCPDHSMRTV